MSCFPVDVAANVRQTEVYVMSANDFANVSSSLLLLATLELLLPPRRPAVSQLDTILNFSFQMCIYIYTPRPSRLIHLSRPPYSFLEALGISKENGGVGGALCGR